MVIGCIEGLCSHGNNIVYTGRDKIRGTQTCSGLVVLLSSPSATWPAKVSGRCSLDVQPVQQVMFDGFQMNQGEVVLHEPEQLDLTFLVRMVDDKQVNGVVWSGTSEQSLNKGTLPSGYCCNNINNVNKTYLKCHIKAQGHRTEINRNKKQHPNWVMIKTTGK